MWIVFKLQRLIELSSGKKKKKRKDQILMEVTVGWFSFVS